MELFDVLSYDDVLLAPSYSEILPGDTDLSTELARGIKLNVPILSSAMDTVTEDRMAIALALSGGAGVIHRNLSPEAQARQVLRVKRFLNWIIDNPVTVDVGANLAKARRIMEETGVTGLPVLDAGKLVGIITIRDLRFNNNPKMLVDDVMTRDLIVETSVPTEKAALAKFDKHRIEKLPIVDDRGCLTGLITVRDMEKHRDYPSAALDSSGSLIVGAAVGPRDWRVRLPGLVASGVDFAVLDTAHGASLDVLKSLREIRSAFDNLHIVGGNVADGDGARRMIEAGADAVKVGIGPGSICTTRIVAGVGVPQFSAVVDAVEVCDALGVPLIADGGIKYSGDIAKAIGAGASAVMIGNLFAGLKEAPGEEVIFEGRIFKSYRGMGSIGAIEPSGSDRYRIGEGEEAVPEGVEGRVPYRGEVAPYLRQLATGVRKAMGYTGCASVEQLRKYRRFVKISAAGLRESHVHDVSVTQDAPNYSKF